MTLKEEIRHGLSCDSIKDAHTVRERVVCLAAHPGRMFIFPLIHWFERRYRGKYRFARLTFLFDIVLLGIAAGLGIIAMAFALSQPRAFSDGIVFRADVAPHEVVSGGSSTLVIRYANRTGEELRDAKMLLSFPDHFVLQEIESDARMSHGRVVDTGTIPDGGTGSVRVRGVMFGDVGGDQSFVSTLTFTHGDDDVPDAKTDTHVFHPTRSTLELALNLPDRIVASQRVDGSLTYRNTGDIDIPEIIVEPEWPEGFVLTGGTLAAPSIGAGEEGAIPFSGTLGETDGDVTFRFFPSFAFGNERYRQETLEHVAAVVPLPLRVSHSVESDSVRPGGSARVTVTYENVGDSALTDVRVGVESDSPFASARTVTAPLSAYPELATLDPGERGTVVIEIPVATSVAQSATRTYEHIPFDVRAFGTFDMDGISDATVRDDAVYTTLTSPVVLDSFARYATPTGDQIGRGPLPPAAGETTKYWVFWNLRNTTNELTNVRIEGELGANVTFTGRQTVSTNAGAAFDANTGEMVWTSDAVDPTFAPSSKVVGIAFELALTPSDDQIGTIPTLIKNVRVTATDAVTGAFVSASGATITTSLPGDAMATGLATVE